MALNRREKKERRREAVRKRVRRNVRGTPERPRLSVFRSNRHLFLQVVDDMEGVTLASLSTEEEEFRNRGFQDGGSVAAAKEAGKLLAERAREAGIGKVVFDRNGYDFHGRVRAVAEAAREGGLDF